MSAQTPNLSSLEQPRAKQAGFSVANAGDVNGAGTGTGPHPVNDIIIGAPNANNRTGAAYLVYGGSHADQLVNRAESLTSTVLIKHPHHITETQRPAPAGRRSSGSGAGEQAGYTVGVRRTSTATVFRTS